MKRSDQEVILELQSEIKIILQHLAKIHEIALEADPMLAWNINRDAVTIQRKTVKLNSLVKAYYHAKNNNGVIPALEYEFEGFKDDE